MTKKMPIKNSSKIFRETDIRPERFDKKRDQAYAKDLAWLLKRSKEFIEVKCPACSSGKYVIKWHKKRLRYLECRDCQTVYISPRPTPEILKEFYQKSEGYKFWNKFIFPASENKRKNYIFRPRVKRMVDLCKKHGTKKNLLVEVGSGFGTFAEEAKKTNFFKQVVAVEPSPELAESCRKKGLKVIEQPIEEVKLTNKADVVASFEVIEHLFDPHAFLKACSRILSKNGLILITCPSIKGFDIATLGTLASSIDHEHLNYFHPESLSRLFERCGFEVVDKLTPGKLDAELVRNEVLRGRLSLDKQPFLQQLLVDRWEELGGSFQNFLAENLLSSHLWLVGRKVK